MEVQGVRNLNFDFQKFSGWFWTERRYVQEDRSFCLVFFNAGLNLGVFFLAHVFSSIWRGMFVFPCFLGGRWCTSAVGKTTKKTKTKKQIKHSWRSLLIDLSNKNLHFTHETHACDVDSISELASPFCNSPYVMRTRCLVSPKPCWTSNVCVVFLAAL